MFLLLKPVFVLASGGESLSSDSNLTHTETETFQIKDTDPMEYNFGESIEINGAKYKLIDVEYETIDRETIYEEKTDEYVMNSDPMIEEVTNFEGIFPTYQDKDGRVYTLKSSEMYQETAIPRSEPADYEITYSQQTSRPQIPDTTEVTLYDEILEQEITAEIPLTNVVQSEAYWLYDFTFNLTIDVASAYYIGNSVIQYNEATPQLAGYENEVLAIIGAPATDYRIDTITWSGAAYTANDGSLKRNAVGTGWRRVYDYTASYQGDVELIPLTEVIYHNTYETTFKDPQYDLLTVEATASYEAVPIVKESKSITGIVAATTGVGVVIVFGVIFFIGKRVKVFNKDLTQQYVSLGKARVRKKKEETVIQIPPNLAMDALTSDWLIKLDESFVKSLNKPIVKIKVNGKKLTVKATPDIYFSA